MADDNEETVTIDYNEVPPSLMMLCERIENLRNVIKIFRGWDPEVAASKACVKTALLKSRKNVGDIKDLLQVINAEFVVQSKEEERARHLQHKCQYILNNIPDRFNPLSSVALPPSQHVTVEKQELAESSQFKSKVQPVQQVSNIPDILFLTVEEFEKVPKYLKGRMTYEKVNSFIELLNKVIASKYAIFKRKKSTLKKKDADLWNEYFKQELKETKGLYFCVANDFKTFNGCALDKTSLNILSILRHCGRIRELRTGGVHRYVTVY